MEQALLVSEQRPTWKVLSNLPSAAVPRDDQSLEEAGSVSPFVESRSGKILPRPASASSPFDYQNIGLRALWLPTATVRHMEGGPRVAQAALEQIRVLHRKQETRRREQEEAKWIQANRKRYAGRWVALLGATLLAEGDSARVVAQASAGAASTPLIVYLENDPPFAGW
jgi:hypothetical protein